MRRLSGFDAAFLYAETPAMPMHGGALTIVDPATAPGFDVDRLREVIAARLDRLDPFRLRLAAPPLGIDRPVWIDGPVDVEQHIPAVGVPRPGTPRQLAELAGRLLAVPLARDRPLWEMWFIEGLADGRVALLVKVHHALLGGTQAMNMFELLFDLDQAAGDAARAEPPARERAPGPVPVAGHAALSLATTPLRFGRAALDGARALTRFARFFVSDQRARGVLPFESPMTSLNGALVAARSLAYCSLPLDDVKLVRRAHGVTVNDVVLGVVGGALRHYLAARDELPARSLTASVPVGATTPGGDGGSVLGNTTSVFGATLATDVVDPVERLHRIHDSTSAAKSLHRALGPAMIEHLSDAVPPGLFGAAIRLYSASGLASRLLPPFSIVVSNMRGPSVTLYSGGAAVVACHVFGPLIESVAIDVTVMSYAGSIDVGLATSPNLVPDPWAIVDAMGPALDELVSAATPGADRSDAAEG